MRPIEGVQGTRVSPLTVVAAWDAPLITARRERKQVPRACNAKLPWIWFSY
jgi:hypothetical protein